MTLFLTQKKICANSAKLGNSEIARPPCYPIPFLDDVRNLLGITSFPSWILRSFCEPSSPEFNGVIYNPILDYEYEINIPRGTNNLY